MSKYLVILDLPNPRIEHAGAKQRIESWSSSKVERLFTQGGDANRIGWVFTTDLPLEEMSFSSVLFSEDSYVFIELGDRCTGDGFRLSGIRDWMRLNYRR